MVTNNFSICVATVNGSGSQSANQILLKSLFRMGIPVSGKNVFPSNIAGLATWFWIRASHQGYLSRKPTAQIVVSLNPNTVANDLNLAAPGAVFVFSEELALPEGKRGDVVLVPVPFKKLVDQATTQPKIKKMITNIVYLGILSAWLKLPREVVEQALCDQFDGKQSVIEPNLAGLAAGWDWATTEGSKIFSEGFPWKAEVCPVHQERIMMDGNTSAALGAIFGGAQFVSWYPITPSSSVVENISKYSKTLRIDSQGHSTLAVVQAEDELAAICMCLGAGWAGARAMTATSGPGISLMSEAAGFAYFAEIPCVVWDVQRVGPSTGLPTRTAQGDLLSTMYLSHGDTKHPLLIPGNIAECFEFAGLAFDLAERLQQLVFVMSDLDLGMNLWQSEAWPYPEKKFDRGKVLSADDLDRIGSFNRYEDTDHDGIPSRTLPGTERDLAAYFTRGSGHNFKAQYSENAGEYQAIMDRLQLKWESARKLVPPSIIDLKATSIGLIAFGTTDLAMAEARDLLAKEGVVTSYLRLRALPADENLLKFIKEHESVIVIEQNRDGQMRTILMNEFPNFSQKIKSVKHYDGTPITAENVVHGILKIMKNQSSGQVHL